MKSSKKHLLRQAKLALRRNGLSWSAVKPTAKEIVVFGSASIGLTNRKSDLDLLVVGKGKRFKNRKLDIVYKSERAVKNRRWLGSELAGHIAKYGTWLDGEGTWVRSVQVSREALLFKRKLIAARANALEKSWKTMSPAYQKKHVVKLRRDLQRLRLLTEGIAIPPTPILDRQWRRGRNGTAKIKLMLKTSGGLIAPRQVALFSPFWNEVNT